MGQPAPDKFSSLPLFAQALVALRMVHRAVLAQYPAGDSERELIESALEAAFKCAHDGQGTRRHDKLFSRSMALCDLADSHRQHRAAVRAALWSAIDSINAAEAASDFPVDATVTMSAQKAIAALGDDRELSRLQIAIVVAADVDQLHFACGEVDKLNNAAAKYTGLGDHVFGRLAPVHPLTVTPYVRTGEDAAR